MALVEQEIRQLSHGPSVVLEKQLDHYHIHHEITHGKFRNQYIKELYENNGGRRIWTRQQTKCLHKYLISPCYNITLIRQSNACLRDFNILEIHDRAIVLLALHRMMIVDAVFYLHAWESSTLDISLPTWLNVTSEYRECFYRYHGFETNSLGNDHTLFSKLQVKVMSGLKIVHEYIRFYGSLRDSFDVIYQDLDFIDFHYQEEETRIYLWPSFE